MSSEVAAPKVLIDQQANVSVGFARELIAEARSIAETRGFALSFAVSDADGFLVCCEMISGAKRMTMRNAIDKSHTAALKRSHSANEKSKPEPKGELVTDSPYVGRMVVMRGGVPIKVNEVVVGAIGASGAKGFEDEEVVVAAFEDLLK